MGDEFGLAVRLIDEYLKDEFEQGMDLAHENFDNIGLLNTTSDDGDDLQVSVDLVNLDINYYINWELVGREHYPSLRELNAKLEHLSWDNLYGWIMDYWQDYREEEQ